MSAIAFDHIPLSAQLQTSQCSPRALIPEQGLIIHFWKQINQTPTGTNTTPDLKNTAANDASAQRT